MKGYEYDSASSEESEKKEHTGTEMPEVNRQEINARAVRRVYLITYSQADEARFPTRQSFVLGGDSDDSVVEITSNHG